MLRSSKLQNHFNDLCKKRKLCYVLIALKNTPEARIDLKDNLTLCLRKLKYFLDNFTPASNWMLFQKQLTYIQLYNTIQWFLDDDSTISDILGVDFRKVFDTIVNLLKLENIDLKEEMFQVANIYTGVYYTDSSFQNTSIAEEEEDCPSCIIDINHYGMGRKYNLCGNTPESDPELPSMSFINSITPNNICSHMISHEEINPLIFLLKHIDNESK